MDDRHDVSQTVARAPHRRSVRKFSISSEVFVKFSVLIAMRSMMSFELAVMAQVVVAAELDYIAVAVHNVASFLAMAAAAAAGN